VCVCVCLFVPKEGNTEVWRKQHNANLNNLCSLSIISDYAKETEIGEICSMNGGSEKYTQFWVWKPHWIQQL
jgi:hypothetical protein